MKIVSDDCFFRFIEFVYLWNELENGSEKCFFIDGWKFNFIDSYKDVFEKI